MASQKLPVFKKSNPAGIFENPYRFLFPIGWILAFVGVLLWILLFWGKISFYPKELHADLMMMGFLVFFSLGFLLTAIPQFTSTQGLTQKEISILFLLGAALLVNLFLPDKIYFYLTLFFLFVFLAYFFVDRIRHRQSLPPPPLIIVFGAFFFGILGSFSGIIFLFNGVELFDQARRIFLYEGVQLFLVLGVGIFLIPNLLGSSVCSALSSNGPASKNKNFIFLRSVPAPLWFVMILLISTLLAQVIFESRENDTHGLILVYGVRGLLILFFAIKAWHLYRFPTHRSFLSWGIWFSSLSFVVGAWLPVFFSAQNLHVRHVMYVGGYGLMTLMIATRVTLAHGGYDLSLEKKSKLIFGIIIFMTLASLTRGVARFLPEKFYEHHLLYAAVSWELALILWATLFARAK